MKLFNLPGSILLILILFTGCASSTIINSIPSNANLYINGKSVGRTPYKHKDTKIVGSSNTVRIEKEGYRTYETSFAKDEKVAIGPLVGGIFLLVPYLWVMKYEEGRIYELRSVDNN